jgi:hypothetical protein
MSPAHVDVTHTAAVLSALVNALEMFPSKSLNLAGMAGGIDGGKFSLSIEIPLHPVQTRYIMTSSHKVSIFRDL